MTVQADITLHQDGTGWNERYYLNPDTDDLRAVAAKLHDARNGILASPGFLRRITVVDLNRPRFPTVVDYDYPGQFTLTGQSDVLSDRRIPATYPALCALMCFRTEKGGRRTFWLNGLPSMELKNGEIVPPVLVQFQLLSRLRALRDALSPANLNLHIEELVADDAAPSSPIDRIDVSASGLYRIHTKTDFPAGENPLVRVMGSRGNNLTRARGIRRITRVEGPRTVIIDRGPLPEGGAIQYSGGAVLRAAVYTFSPAAWVPYGQMPLQKVPNTGITFLPRQLRRTDPFIGEFGIGVRQRGDGPAEKRGRRRVR